MPSESLSRYVRPVVVAALEDSAASAARKMRDKRVGCVVVVRENARPVGILTDRDLALRVVAEGLDPETTRLERIVTYDPITLPETATVDRAVLLMGEHGIRRLPIVNDGSRLLGIVTADDLIMRVSQQLAAVGDAVAEPSDSQDSR